MKKYTILLIVLLIDILVVQTVFSQSYYINSSAVGDNSGRDWANAFNSVPDSLERGATYYITRGQYGSVEFDTPAQGAEYITVKWATAQDHGTNVGWNSSWSYGRAEFSQVRFLSPYFVFSGKKRDRVHEYGIYIHRQVDGKCLDVRNMDGSDAHHITVEYVEMEHAGMDMAGYNNSDVIFLFGWDGDWVHDITIRYSYAHDVTRTILYIMHGYNLTFDNNIFANCQNDVGIHGEGVAWHTRYGSSSDVIDVNTVWSNNIWKDIEGAGIIVIGLQHNDEGRHHENMRIFGNVFYSTDEKFMLYDGIICALSDNGLSNVEIYNNTFAYMNSPWNSLYIFNTDFGSNNRAFNNIVYDWKVPSAWDNIDNDYNLYFQSGGFSEQEGQVGSEDLFADGPAGDFRLTRSTLSGAALSGEFSIDPTGAHRGADGIWDRGAYEYSGTDSVILDTPRGITLAILAP